MRSDAVCTRLNLEESGLTVCVRNVYTLAARFFSMFFFSNHRISINDKICWLHGWLPSPTTIPVDGVRASRVFASILRVSGRVRDFIF